MMSWRVVLKVMSFLLMLIGIAMAASWLVSVAEDDPHAARRALAVSALITLVTAAAVRWLTRGPTDLSLRDGIAVATFGWIAVAALGTLPYLLSGVIRDPVSALFETVSGFTTTGASVLQETEPVPRGILFWRALTHFLGGMGVIVLCVAVLPLVGSGGMQLYRAEVAGPWKDRLTPRIANTAKLLWSVYASLCLAEAVLLRLGGMSWFDAFCHSFATIATGGFSTRTVSIQAFNSLYIEIVIVVFMLAGATNFSLHYGLFRGNGRGFWRDAEFRFFIGVWAAGCALVTLDIWRSAYASFGQALRNGVFAATSLFTTTGFSTGDFNLWPATSRLVLLGLMVMGGCVGSTAGGIKQLRILIVFRKIAQLVRQFMHPQAVVRVKVGANPIEPAVVASILAFSLLYVAALAVGAVVMTFFTKDILSAVSAVIATTGGVGPGLGLVGPLQNYACIPAGGKIVLMLCMLLGRLEFYSVLALFLPSFWKK
jgi:trk system potassium uptake protein TrkH